MTTSERIAEILAKLAAQPTCRPGKEGCGFDDPYRCAVHEIEDEDVRLLLGEIDRLSTDPDWTALDEVRWRGEDSTDNPPTKPANPTTLCCLDNAITTHWSDGYTQKCKMHGAEHTTDTGWTR